MSTIEHLFMQIFEQRGWIQAQLRQQADSYAQSLASNLLADGFQPPPWLLASRPESHAGLDPKEMNREQLISGILMQRTAHSVNNCSLFTLPSQRSDTIFLSKKLVPGTFDLDKAMLKNYPRDSGLPSDTVIHRELDDARDGVDPFARIQRSRSRQRDIESRLQKKQRVSKHAGVMISVDGFTGRMTRSRAASPKPGESKKVLEPQNLLTVNLDGHRVTRSRAKKLQSLDVSSKPDKLATCMEYDIHFAGKAGVDVCTASSVAQQLEPKQLLFDGVEVCDPQGKSVNASEAGSLGVPDESGSAKLDSSGLVNVELSSGDSKGGHESLPHRHLKQHDLSSTTDIICLEEGDVRISNESLEVETYAIDLETACQTLPHENEAFHSCGSPSKSKFGSHENKLLHSSPVRDCNLSPPNSFLGHLSNLQGVCAEEQHMEIKDGLVDQNSEAHNCSSTRCLLEKHSLSIGQDTQRMGKSNHGTSGGSEAELELLKVDDSEHSTHPTSGGLPLFSTKKAVSCNSQLNLSGHLGSQVGSRSLLKGLGEYVQREHCNGSTNNAAPETMETSNTIATSEIENKGNTSEIAVKIAERVQMEQEKGKCGSSEKADCSLVNSGFLEGNYVQITEVTDCLDEVNTDSQGGCRRCNFSAINDLDGACQPEIDNGVASQGFGLLSSEVTPRNNENASTYLECTLNTSTELLDCVTILQFDENEISLHGSVHNEEESNRGLINKRTDGPLEQHTSPSCSGDGAKLFDALVEVDEAENAAAMEEGSVENTITPADSSTLKAILDARQLSTTSNMSAKSFNCCKINGLVSKNSSGFLEQKRTSGNVVQKCVAGQTPSSCEVPYLILEPHLSSWNSVNADEKFGSCKANGSSLPVCTENGMAGDFAEKHMKLDTLTPNGTESQNEPPIYHYFLRSQSNCVKNSASSKSNDPNASNGLKRPLEAVNDAREITWPKRRKMVPSDNIVGTSPRKRLKPTLPLLEKEDFTCKVTAGNDYQSTIEFQPLQLASKTETIALDIVGDSISAEPHHKRRYIEDNTCLKGSDWTRTTSSLVKYETLKISVGDDVGVAASFIQHLEENHTSKDVQNCQFTGNAFQHQSQRKSDLYEESNQGMIIHEGRQILPTHDSVRLSLNDYGLVAGNESMPEFEGFSIGASSMTENEITFDDSVFSNLVRKRESLLEQLCPSSIILTPLSHTLTKYKIHEVPDIYQSLPAGVLESMNLSSSLKVNSTGMKQLGTGECSSLTSLYSNMESEPDSSLSGRPHPHSLPSSSARFGSGVRKPPLTPPVGKISQRSIIGRSCSSSDKVGSNPELTCFRIDEDSCTTEENGNLSELEDTSVRKVQSRGVKVTNYRKVLGDMTSSYQNMFSLVFESKHSPDRRSMDSVNMESYFRARMDVCPAEEKCTYHKQSKTKDKENYIASVSANVMRKASDSISSKPAISVKGKERSTSHTILGKTSKPSNIVSNISSFIPLVRQKQQAAAPAAGKRDIKVKALEAAEAAKRLEEKRQNEREMRKAAAKLERERLEQENAKQLELQQKQKEEARKQKEADIAARKRQREEEKKENERKRRCIQETKMHKKRGGERLPVGKAEKYLNQKAANEKEPKRKELVEAEKHKDGQQNDREAAASRKATAVESNINKVAAVEDRYGSNSMEAHDLLKESNDSQKVCGNLYDMQKAIQDRMSFTKQKSQALKSYEISPYKDSDDEDGEEEDNRRRKRIPSWARKEFLDHILLSTRHIDPVKVFSRKKSSDLSEVLTSRILRRPLSQLR